jgi:hypothetical protein
VAAEEMFSVWQRAAGSGQRQRQRQRQRSQEKETYRTCVLVPSTLEKAWHPMGDCVLGFDLSTQSLSVVVVHRETGQIVHQYNANFGQCLPHYESPSGFIPSEGATTPRPPLSVLGRWSVLCCGFRSLRARC